MMDGIQFDMSGWSRKSARVQAALKGAVKKAVEFGMDEVNKEAAKNLAGIRHDKGTPAPYPGKLPVTQITGNLHGSIRSKRIRDDLGAVFSAGDKADYNRYVHDGTRRMRARPFMTEAVRGKKEAVLRRMKNETTLAIRREGR